MSMSNKERQAKRRESLNDLARSLGFESWTKFETAAINGEVIVTTYERKNQVASDGD